MGEKNEWPVYTVDMKEIEQTECDSIMERKVFIAEEFSELILAVFVSKEILDASRWLRIEGAMLAVSSQEVIDAYLDFKAVTASGATDKPVAEKAGHVIMRMRGDAGLPCNCDDPTGIVKLFFRDR